MTKDEATARSAMKLALEALETERENYQDWDKQDGAPEYIYEAITALREALAEQPAQQEPVAWICEGSSSDEKHAIDYWPGDIEDIPIGTKLYTFPPAQRTWVGLTDDEFGEIYYRFDGMELMRAIEAKLKEKNT